MASNNKPNPPTLDEIKSWPATVDVVTAGSAFGIGRNRSYELAGREQFPVPVLKIGQTYRVVVSELLAVLDKATDATSAA